MMRVRAGLLILVLACGSPGAADAKDLGTFGATFPVAEPDLLSVLLARLKSAEASGRITALNRAFAARVKAKLSRPPPVAGLTETRQPRSWLFDPSIRVPQDIADPSGRVFARAGDLINPLDRLPGFNRVLIFVDGDAPRQVGFAVKRAKRDPKARAYIVLTAGAPLELMRRTKTELYFDQGGTLTRHFGITQTPAVVERDGRALRISEVQP